MYHLVYCLVLIVISFVTIETHGFPPVCVGSMWLLFIPAKNFLNLAIQIKWRCSFFFLFYLEIEQLPNVTLVRDRLIIYCSLVDSDESCDANNFNLFIYTKSGEMDNFSKRFDEKVIYCTLKILIKL